MNDFFKEHLEVLRQYFLSDDVSIKQKILASVPALLLKYILTIQEGFDKNMDAETIASQIQALEFVEEIVQIKSMYDSKISEIKNLEFEQELASAIKLIEREYIKKKLIAIEETIDEELTDHELKAAITLVERESLKEKLRKLENDSKGKIIPLFFSKLKNTAASNTLNSSLLKYAAAACIFVAVGIWYYHFSRKDNGHKEFVTVPPTLKQDTITKDLFPNLKPVYLAEVSIDTISSKLLLNGLGFVEVTKSITIIVHNQQRKVKSLKKAIENHQVLLNDELGSSKPDTAKIINELRNRITSLQKELTFLNKREHQYIFDGKVLSLFVSSPIKEQKMILYDDTYYLKKDNGFYKLTVSMYLQPFKIETDPAVLKTLDKIIYNAD